MEPAKPVCRRKAPELPNISDKVGWNAGGLSPGGERESSPEQELLGVITSHGPSRESYNSERKATSPGQAQGAPGADAAVSAERGAAGVFVPGRRASAIAARIAGQRRASGRDGRPNSATARPGPANRSATAKASAAGSASAAGNPPSRSRLRKVMTRAAGLNFHYVFLYCTSRASQF